MKRRQFLQTTVSTAGAITLNQTFCIADQHEKPNFMLVIADDMYSFDSEPYGNQTIQTPNMAKLANEGICFDAMFTSTAMCSPSRQQLYTGLYPVRNGAYPNHSRVYEGTKSIAHYLKNLGYRVGLLGKKHFNPPESYPFEFFGDVQKEHKYIDTQSISEFVNRDTSQPYCLIVCSDESHKPWNQGDPEQYNHNMLNVPPHLVDCPETREEMTKYYAEISFLDKQLGECMKIVDQSKQAENTLLMFTSEQGAQFPSQGKWSCYDTGLKTAFIARWPKKIKPGSRTNAMTQYVDVVPTLIEAAGGSPENIDTECPDAEGYKGFDGKSFLQVMLGETNQLRNQVYGAHTTRGIITGSACYPIRSVRSTRYKLIKNLNHEAVFYNVALTRQSLFQAWKKYAENDPAIAKKIKKIQYRPAEELYDLQNDPFELNNLAENSEYASVKKTLNKKLEKWMKQQGDKGIETELKANDRQGRNGRPNWEPYEPEKK